MPIYQNFTQEEEDKKKIPDNFKLSAGTPSSFGAKDSKGKVAAGLSNTDTQKKSGWTNLQNYRDANAGEGNRMAGEIVDKAGTQAEEDKGLIQSQISEKTGAVGDEAQGFDADYFVDPSNIDYEQFQNIYNQDFDPSKYALGDDFAFTRGDKGDLKSLWGSITANTKNSGGREALLADKYAKGGNYSQGMKGFDDLLLGGEGYQGLTSGMDTHAESVTEASDAAIGEYQGFLGARDKEVDEARGKFQDEYNKVLSSATDEFINSQNSNRPDFGELPEITSQKQLDELFASYEKQMNDARSAYMSKGKAAADKLNALGMLTGKDAASFDYDKGFGDTKLDRTVAKKKLQDYLDAEETRKHTEALNDLTKDDSFLDGITKPIAKAPFDVIDDVVGGYHDMRDGEYVDGLVNIGTAVPHAIGESTYEAGKGTLKAADEGASVLDELTAPVTEPVVSAAKSAGGQIADEVKTIFGWGKKSKKRGGGGYYGDGGNDDGMHRSRK